MHEAPVLSRSALLGLALAFASPVDAQFQPDPMAPGLRWGDFAVPTSPWIPLDVALGARGELCLAGAAVGQQALHLYSTSEQGFSTPSVSWNGVAGALGQVQVEAGDEPDELYSLAQMPEPDATQRRTLVRAHDPATLQPRWTHDMGLLSGGTARLTASQDGERVVAALHDKAGKKVRVDWLDGSSGALEARLEVAGLGLFGLEATVDGERVAVMAGLDLWVLEPEAGSLFHHALSAVSEAMALSGDGEHLAYGIDDGLRVMQWTGAGFVESTHLGAQLGEVVTRADYAEEGDTLAIAYWSTLAGSAVRVQCTDKLGNPLGQWVQPPTSGGLQNLPAGLDVSADGSRVALGLWGSGGSEPEFVLLPREGGVPIATANLVGSVHALDLGDDGTRAAIGIKQAHANQVGTTGAVLLYDTGERDLQQLSAAYVGGTLELLSAGAPNLPVLFFFGTPTEQGLVVPGFDGSLRLRLDQPLAQFQAHADAGGRAPLLLPVPNQAGMAGLWISVQTLSPFGPDPGFSTARIAPILL